MKNRIIYLSAIIFSVCQVNAQDYHLSQYDVASLYLNPASTGMYGNDAGDYKIYLDHRSQWRSLGVKPFLTSHVGYDMPYQINGKKVGFGAYILNNNGGAGNYNTFTFMGSAAYDILSQKASGVSTTGKSDHLLSIGLQMGLFYRSTNPDALNYDVQYMADNGTFDQSIYNNENYRRVNITRFDACYGLYYRYLDKNKKAHPFAGFSMSHLTRPNESLSGGVTRIPIKINGYAGCDIKINDKAELTPRVLFMTQARATEVVPGIILSYRINEKNAKIIAGFDYRVNDACIASIGFKDQAYSFRFSYDINTSYLKNYTNGKGAYEISLIYTGKKKDTGERIRSDRRY